LQEEKKTGYDNPLGLKDEHRVYNLNQGVFNGNFYYGKLIDIEGSMVESLLFDNGKTAINYENVLVEGFEEGYRGKVKTVMKPFGKNQIRDAGIDYKVPLIPQNNALSNKNYTNFVELTKKHECSCAVGVCEQVTLPAHTQNTTQTHEYFVCLKSGDDPLALLTSTQTTLVNVKLSGFELIKKISSLQNYYMDVTDDKVFLIGSAYVLASYCYTLFDSVGYLFFNSDKESGKTKYANLLGLLSFHTVNSTSPSESALFRITSLGKGLMVIDDFENLPDERRNAINQILKIGYRKEGAVIRTEKQKDAFTVQLFDCFCPKIITNTTTLEPVTLSRCIPVHLMKTVTVKGKRYPKDRDAVWQNVRDACHLWVLTNWARVRDIYEAYECDLLNNRDLELVKGMLAIMKSIDEGLHDILLEYLVKCFVERETVDLTGSWEYEMYDEMRRNSPEDGAWVSTKNVVKWVQDRILTEEECETAKEYKKKVGKSLPTARYVGRRLSRVPSFKKRRVGAGVEYFLSKALLENFMKIKGFYYEEQKTLGEEKKEDAPVVENVPKLATFEEKKEEVVKKSEEEKEKEWEPNLDFRPM